MMEKPVSHSRLVDISWLRIGNVEGMISGMGICFCLEISVQSENVVGKPVLELLHVSFAALPFQEFLPCFEQIFDRNDIVVHHDLFKKNTFKNPPPLVLFSKLD